MFELALLPPRVNSTTARVIPAAPATIPILAHFEDHHFLCLASPSPTIRVTFDIEIVVSPNSFPREAVTWT